MKDFIDSLVIGTAFIGISGLVGWFLVVKPVQQYFRIGGWDRVPASITDVQLIEANTPSQDSTTTTYRCEASYHYEFGEKTYQASKVSIYEGNDNLSNFHQRLFDELSRHEKSGKPFRAYVNPDDPEEAVLYRELRPGVTLGVLFLVLLFSAAGATLIVKAARELRARRPTG